MFRNEYFPISNKNLAYILVSLLAVAVIFLGHKADAASNTYSGGGRACDTTTAPTPYTNGAPMARAFYPADGSTVTVTSTGAVIKQSPCQTPYREGWVNPENICNLNSFGQLGGMISSSDSNPYPNSQQYNSSSCGSGTSTTTAPTPAPVPVPATATATSNAQATNITNVNTPATTQQPVNNTYPNNNTCYPNNSTCYTSNGCTSNDAWYVSNGYCQPSNSTPATYTPAHTGKPAYVNNTQPNSPYYTQSATTTIPSGKTTTTLPDTGASTGSVMSLGGVSTLVGTLGHFFYRRRAFN